MQVHIVNFIQSILIQSSVLPHFIESVFQLGMEIVEQNLFKFFERSLRLGKLKQLKQMLLYGIEFCRMHFYDYPPVCPPPIIVP